MRRRTLRTRFWFEAGLAALTLALMLLTLVNGEWIEWLTGMDPDGGDGSLEWIIVGACLFASVMSAVMARLEWRRTPVPA